MSIFDRSPASWQELQSMVGQMFEEMGCDVDVSRRISHVRGTKEIDVFVQDTTATPPATYLIECKYWTRPIPQEVIHAFRTVMNDIGAHQGYVVSRNGFQEGAHAAAQNTNIDLISFDNLQDIFKDRWRIAMAERFMPDADNLFKYWDPSGGRMPQIKWNDSHVSRHRKLVEAYLPFIHLGPLSEINQHRFKLPLTLPRINNSGHISGSRSINTYRELYDFFSENKDNALYHFQVLHGEIIPNRIEGEYHPDED